MKIPVASNTVNSLLLRRLGKEKEKHFNTKGKEGVAFYFSYRGIPLFNDESEGSYRTLIT